MMDNTILNESMKVVKHKSGLTVYLLKKPDYYKSTAIFATKYGAIDSKWKNPKTGEIVEVPDGIAHFLEHKMFEQEDETNVFAEYAKFGGNANAFTSSNTTAYYFSSTEHFYENLGILLNFVEKPYFTPENVAKEQGIIGQEIRMYDDDPDWCLYFNFLKNLYKNHNIRKDPAGTIESIAKIDAPLLYECYNTFYHPSNMVLVVVGQFEEEKVFEIIDQKIPCQEQQGKIERLYETETEEVVKNTVEQVLEVGTPKFMAGGKLLNLPQNTYLKNEIVLAILLKLLFSKTSDLFTKLYQNGIINENFYPDLEHTRDYCYWCVSGESENPDLVFEEMKTELSNLSDKGVREEEFICAKRSVLGTHVRRYNDPELLSRIIMDYAFQNADLFAYETELENITKEDINEMIRRLVNNELVLSVIKPS